jgi:glycine cleavage system H protein
MRTIEGIYYTAEHEWVKIEGDIATIGVTDYAQHELGDIAYVEFPSIGDAFKKGDAFGVLESPKAVSDIYMPVSGTVTEVNSALDDDPGAINEDAYEAWISRVRVTDDAQGETGDLLDKAAYEAILPEDEE